MSATLRRFRIHLFSFAPGRLASHKNLMPCVIIGDDGGITVRNGEDSVIANALCIKPNCEHSLVIKGAGAEIVFLDGLTMREDAFDFFALDSSWLDLPNAIREKDYAAIDGLADTLRGKPIVPDPEIMDIVDEIYASSIKRLSQFDLAERLNLERTRALRRFKNCTGQTFRKFKIWSASVNAVRDIHRGERIGDAGIDYGFSDASHVARTANSIFGLTPSEGIKGLRGIISV